MTETVSILNLLIAFVVALLMGAGMLVANNRHRDRRTSERFKAVHDRIAAVDCRVDDTRESFVHNDHLQQIASDFKDGLSEVRTEVRGTNERIDKVLGRMIDAAEGKHG